MMSCHFVQIQRVFLLLTEFVILSLALTNCSGDLQGFHESIAASSGISETSTVPGIWPNTGIMHGSQLTTSMVGPAALGVSMGQLRKMGNIGDVRLGTFVRDGRPSWIPGTPYVYNNDPNNHGGVVPAGGMIIDGFSVPEGVWVSQFNDFVGQGMVINGDNEGTTSKMPGVVFRGNRWRGAMSAPGFLNVAWGSHTHIWIFYCDAGGLGPADSQMNDVPFKIGDITTNSYFFRNYISYTTTGLQPLSYGAQIIENYVEKITYYYNGDSPPGETTGKHLNGIAMGDGIDNALILRNKVLVQSPDDAGRVVGQTDAISFIQDPSPAGYTGAGGNLDGSIGYMVKDNYMGGGGYALYAGLNGGRPATSVKNMQVIGNQFTTQWWANSGYYGPVAGQPIWGSYGNINLNNIWADGPKMGKPAF